MELSLMELFAMVWKPLLILRDIYFFISTSNFKLKMKTSHRREEMGKNTKRVQEQKHSSKTEDYGEFSQIEGEWWWLLERRIGGQVTELVKVLRQ
jgi:hypothetical protein